MASQKRNLQRRNLTQEFETLLNGRSILELTAEELATALELLTQIVKAKPLKSLTKVELQALVEWLAEITATNMFNGSIPEDWKRELLTRLENTPEKEWEWSYTTVLDYYLHNIEMWDTLDAEEREVVAKTMLKYLDGEESYYDYCTSYIEDYLEE